MDLVNYKITPLGASAVTIPRATIEATVVDSSNQALVLADLTGAAAIQFPAVLGQLSAADRAEFIAMVAGWLIQKRAGL